MRRIRIFVVFALFVLQAKSQAFRDNYIGTYLCQYTYHQGSLTVHGTKRLYISEDSSDSGRIMIEDTSNIAPQKVAVNLYSDSTFKDTIHCYPVKCFFGKFYDRDSIYYLKGDIATLDYFEYYGVKIPTVGIDELNLDHGISIYPNPCSGKLIIHEAGNADERITLSAADGKLVDLPKHGDEYDVSHLSPGVYVLQVRTAKEIVTRKIIKN